MTAALTAAITGDIHAAERLWTVLTRATRAVLLAVHAYLGGDGVLAVIALDVARRSAPGDILAQVLDVARRHGTRPAQPRRFSSGGHLTGRD